jgi:hypothetical protein
MDLRGCSQVDIADPTFKVKVELRLLPLNVKCGDSLATLASQSYCSWCKPSSIGHARIARRVRSLVTRTATRVGAGPTERHSDSGAEGWVV